MNSGNLCFELESQLVDARFGSAPCFNSISTSSSFRIRHAVAHGDPLLGFPPYTCSILLIQSSNLRETAVHNGVSPELFTTLTSALSSSRISSSDFALLEVTTLHEDRNEYCDNVDLWQ